jgi:starch synthase (maltosyl-transferring)
VPIALVITDLDVGGAERALVSLATGLDRRRWEPRVIALGPEGALAGPLREAGVTTECLGIERSRPVRGVLRLAGALRARRPELVQSFLFHANVASRLAARLARVPWVVGGLRVAEREKQWHLLLDALTFRLSAGSVCVSEGVRRFSRDVGRLAPDRLVTIPNGVDPVPFDRAAPLPREAIGVPPGAHLAVFVGRMEPQKGVPVLLDAAGRVAARRPDWHLALAGDGPGLDEYRRRAAGMPALTDRVRWLGRRDDIPALLKTADVLVLPSFWEGMPNVVLEAMAAGRAVVATRVEGTEDLIIPGATGWLVPPGDAAALAEALEEAVADPERCRRLGEAGRARVDAEFAPGRVVEAYDRLWSGLLGIE